ncbi:MAG TPA: creatininase family protein [Dongiaceae bacterium]|jgi:creatinine amidohydrolase
MSAVLAAAPIHLLQQRLGSHADERETSIMLAIMSPLVRVDRSREPPPGIFTTPTTMQSLDASASDCSATGAFGDPTLASAEKGRALLDAMIEDLVQGLLALFPDLAQRAP